MMVLPGAFAAGASSDGVVLQPVPGVLPEQLLDWVGELAPFRVAVLVTWNSYDWIGFAARPVMLTENSWIFRLELAYTLAFACPATPRASAAAIPVARVVLISFMSFSFRFSLCFCLAEHPSWAAGQLSRQAL